MIAASHPVQSPGDGSGRQPAADSSRPGISSLTKIKVIGSVLIGLHLVAIVLPPASVPPASRAVQNAWSWFQPYIQFAYLNHGYHYFAPDPGPSSLIEYTVITDDGERIWGRIPDREAIWPRLRYHRYFMLTEFYGGLPPAAQQMRQAVAQSYAQQLMENHNGVNVELAHVVHRLSTREEMLAGGSLDEPHKYEYTSLGTFSIEDPVVTPTLSEPEVENSDDGQPETIQPPSATAPQAEPPSDLPPPASDPIEAAPAVQ